MRGSLGFTLSSVFVVAASLLIERPALAGGPAPTAVQAPATCAPQVITKTIMVPQVTYKTMTVKAMVCRPEARQTTVKVCKLIPETKTATCQLTVMVPEQRKQTVAYTECHMTYEDVTRNVTVMVPHTETKQAVRTVCKPVQAQEMRTVCKDMGKWETKAYVDACGCTCTCPVWVPNIVTEQVQVTVYKPQFVEEPYTFDAVVCTPEVKQITQRIAKPIYETKTREITCTVAVPRFVERQMPVTTCRPVIEEKVLNYTAMVPTQVDRQISVPVCNWVPKTVTCTVPACDCNSGCGWR
jgi:hypothetical protein